MGTGGPADAKKSICRALTNVVKASPLKDAIDPKNFFMMVNANFQMLFASGKFNFSPLWDALAQTHPPELMVGTFLKFDEAVKRLGFSTMLPAAVAKLTEEERLAHVSYFDDASLPPNWLDESSGLTPTTPIMAVQADAPPLSLSTDDLKPLIPDDLKRRITQAVVQAIRQTEIAQKIDGAQLAFWVDSNFDAVCNGITFRFQPIKDALQDLEVADSDLYLAIVKLRESLQPLSIALEEPKLDLTDDLRQAIERQAAKRDADPVTPAASRPAIKANEPPKEGEPAPQKRADKYGYSKGKNEAQAKVVRAVRIGVLAVFGAIALGYGWFTRPTRGLDATDFAIPMTAAQLIRNTFTGTLDESKWYAKRYADRESAVKAMAQQLRDHGWLNGAQLRDNQHRLVVVGSARDLHPSLFVMRDRLPANDPTAPKDEAIAPSTQEKGAEASSGGAAQK